ncbi:MAG: hypothetical protein ACM34K_18310 [Bacillota bacterium]
MIISDFRREVGEIADILSYNREFLGRTPSPKQAEAYVATWGEKGGEWSNKHHEIVLLVGMKGGKNLWAEGDVSYAGYFISSLVDPHAYFTKITKSLIKYPPEKTFDLVNVSSVDEAQAKRAFFDSVKKVLQLTKDPRTGDNWFERYAGLDLRETFGDVTAKEIIFPSRQRGVGNIRLMSFNSTKKAPEGVHILRFYADELSRADTKATYREAKGLYELGLNNTRASFPNRIGKVLGWSYPNDTDFDLTNERYELSFKTDAIYGIKCSTFDFNPSRTREMFQDAYDTDPIAAKRVYECIKSTSKQNFYQPYVEKIREVVQPEVENRVKYKLISVSKEAKEKVYEFTGVEILSLIGDNRVRCFAADPSKIRDRFVIVGGYNETINPLKYQIFIGDTQEVLSTNVKPIVDFMLVIEPMDKKPIDYVGIGEIFATILKNFPNTQSINSDHFQNEKLRQEVISKGVRAETYFFSNEKQVRLYKRQRANIWNNNVTICQDDQKFKFDAKEMNLTDLYIHESEHLILEGNKIDHPENGSKDLTDAIAIVVNDLLDLEAAGVNEDINLLTETKLKQLCEIFMQEKYKLIEAEIPEEQMLPILADKLNISMDQIEKLAQFVKEIYKY